MSLINVFRDLFATTLYFNQAIATELARFYELLQDSETPEGAFDQFDQELGEAPYSLDTKEEILAIIQERFEDAQNEYDQIQSELN